MKTYLFLLIGLFLLSVTACKKGDKPASTTNTATGPKLLRQYKMLTDGDTTGKFSYTYDSNNRISTSNAKFYESGTLEDEETFTFTYETIDSLPSHVHIAYVDYISPFSDAADEYFFYDASRTLIKDSISDGSGGDLVYYYHYYADHIFLTTNFFDTVINRLDKVNGNIVSEKDSISGGFLVDSFVYNNQISYDNHPNPFYKTGIKRVFFYIPENYVDDDLMPAVKNNITEFTSSEDGSPPGNEHQQYTYTYDSDGYPVTLSGTDLTGGSTLKGFYYY